MARRVHAQVQNTELVQQRRHQIIKAAIAVFRRKGFHVATTGDVAEEADVTQSNLYNYIRSKGDILYLVCSHLMQLYGEAVDEAVALHEDPYDRLVEALRAIVRVMAGHREEVQLLYNETHALEKRDRKLVLATISQLIDRFQDLISSYEAKHGEIQAPNKRLAANLLSFVPAILALRAWDLHESTPDMERGIVEFLLKGLGIPVPAQ